MRLQWVREFLWRHRQKSRSYPRFDRPVLDLIDFGDKPGVVLDVGANRGGFATSVLVRAPLMQVHCFEPNRALTTPLSEKAIGCGLYKGAARLVVNMVACGETAGPSELNVSAFDQASSIMNVSSATRAGWPTVDFSTSHRQTVDTIRLDGYLNDRKISGVKLLKLDVQGYELEVLKGCGEMIKRIEYIISEVQFIHLYENAPLWTDIVSFAGKLGFRPLVMDGFCFGPDGEALQADVLFRKT